jgi:hypothetical protein
MESVLLNCKIVSGDDGCTVVHRRLVVGKGMFGV